MTEHSASIFVFFFLGEYSSLILMSAFMSIFFLGGYHCPNLYNIVLDPISDIYYFFSYLFKNKSEIIDIKGGYLFNWVYIEFKRIYLDFVEAIANNKELLYFYVQDHENFINIVEDYNLLLKNRDYIYDCLFFSEVTLENILNEFKLNYNHVFFDEDISLTLSNIKVAIDNIQYIMDVTDWYTVTYSLIKELFIDNSVYNNNIIEYSSNESRFLQSMNILIDRIYGSYIFGFKIVIVVFFFIWVRASFPRLRYDQLMSLCWKELLPLVFGYIIFSISIFSTFNMVPFGTGF
jgi:NADH dehydrogenase